MEPSNQVIEQWGSEMSQTEPEIGRIRPILITGLILVICGSCSKSPQPVQAPAHPALPRYRDPPTYDSGANFTYDQSPLQLMDLLAEANIVTVPHRSPPNWIKPKDVDALIRFVRSDQPCGFIVNDYSSWRPLTEHSTVGREARFILLGYRTAEFPPDLTTREMVFFNAEDAEKWYAAGHKIEPGFYQAAKDLKYPRQTGS